MYAGKENAGKENNSQAVHQKSPIVMELLFTLR